MNLLKAVLALSTVGALVGCKLVMEVGEGGYVESASGDCQEFSTCSTEIMDATFNETYTAVAKGGYAFSHWRGGDGYQCPGSENPVCQVSNTQFAGNEGAEAHIASDAEYYLEPVFRMLRTPSPIVVDAKGKVVGPLIQFDFAHSDNHELSIAVHFEETGNEVFLLEADYRSSLTPTQYVRGQDYLYYDNGNCTGTPHIKVGITKVIGANGYNQREHFLHSVAGGPNGSNWVADPDAAIPGNNVSLYSHWNPYTESCKSPGGLSTIAVPAIPVSMSFEYPLHVEMR